MLSVRVINKSFTKVESTLKLVFMDGFLTNIIIWMMNVQYVLEDLGDHICKCNKCSKRFCFDCIDKYTATRLTKFDDAPCPMCGQESGYSVSSLRQPSIVGRISRTYNS